jgi:hypothetical protein
MMQDKTPSRAMTEHTKTLGVVSVALSNGRLWHRGGSWWSRFRTSKATCDPGRKEEVAVIQGSTSSPYPLEPTPEIELAEPLILQNVENASATGDFQIKEGRNDTPIIPRIENVHSASLYSSGRFLLETREYHPITHAASNP